MDVEDQILEDIVSGVMETTVGVSCRPSHGGGETELGSAVGILGGWDGAVVISVSRALADNVSSRMFQVAAGNSSEADLRDAVGELANQVAGSIKSMLPSPSKLLLPERRDSISAANDNPTPRQLRFVVAGEPLWLTLMERTSVARTDRKTDEQ